MKTYEFKVEDAEGKNFEGTIEAENSYEAFCKLVDMHKFKVLSIYELGSTEEEKAMGPKNAQTFYKKPVPN